MEDYRKWLNCLQTTIKMLQTPHTHPYALKESWYNTALPPTALAPSNKKELKRKSYGGTSRSFIKKDPNPKAKLGGRVYQDLITKAPTSPSTTAKSPKSPKAFESKEDISIIESDVHGQNSFKKREGFLKRGVAKKALKDIEEFEVRIEVGNTLTEQRSEPSVLQEPILSTQETAVEQAVTLPSFNIQETQESAAQENVPQLPVVEAAQENVPQLPVVEAAQENVPQLPVVEAPQEVVTQQNLIQASLEVKS